MRFLSNVMQINRFMLINQKNSSGSNFRLKHGAVVKCIFIFYIPVSLNHSFEFFSFSFCTDNRR